MSVKPAALAIVKIEHEAEAEIEILDCILPYDLESRVVKLDIPGVLLIESKLNGKDIINIFRKCFVSQAKKIIPIDRVIKDSIGEILNNVIMLSENIKDSNKTFKIYLKNYGKLSMSKELMNIIAEKLKKERGWTVNLKDPDIIVFLFIFNWGTLLSLVESDEIWELKKFL